MKIGNRDFELKKNKMYIMGILNVTPDSFSDGGKFNACDKALFRAEEMIEQGVDIIDIGGESTRPGYDFIEPLEEGKRIEPIIRAIRERMDIPISIDTYKSQVAEIALSAGADLVNDIWGLKYDGLMAKIISEFQVPCCLMHNREKPVYHNYLEDVKDDLRESIAIGKRAGILTSNMILDPGIGFAKTQEQNLKMLGKLDVLKKFEDMGCALLLGASRKSVIDYVLNLPVDERLEGTLATTMVAFQAGYHFVRVHDVKEHARVVRMLEAIYN